MLIVSVGTGTSPHANEELMPGEMNLLYNATSIPSALMYAASNEQDFLCRVFGRTLCGDHLDNELGDLMGPSTALPSGRVPGPVQPKLFTYMRYNAELTTAGLTALGLPQEIVRHPEYVQQIETVDHIKELQAVGTAVGQHKVRQEHFAGFLR